MTEPMTSPAPQRDGPELVDILDVRGNPVYACDKLRAHAAGLLHRTVVSEVFDSRGRWLLVRQADDRQDAGRWVSPVGGHVQAGETPAAALRRETREELGFDLSHAREVGTYVYRRDLATGTVENHLFIAYEQETDEVPVLNHESVEFRYFEEAELRALLAAEPDRFGEAFHVISREVYASRLIP